MAGYGGNIEIVTVVVVSSEGPNPGPASGITYTCDVNTRRGTLRFVGVKPANDRPPDEIDIRAARPGSVWPGAFVSGTLQAFIFEWPDFGPCDGGAA